MPESVLRIHPHHLHADPDPSFDFDADSDPTLDFDVDPDPNPPPHQSDTNRRSVVYTVKKVRGFPVPSRDVTYQTFPGRE